MRLSAVVPVLDEEPTLDELHRRLSLALASVAPDFEIVFVNDGSRDGSLERMKAIAAKDANVVVVDLRHPHDLAVPFAGLDVDDAEAAA